MAKRIQMRKNRFTMIQKIAAEKKLGVDPNDPDHAPKQTVSGRPMGDHCRGGPAKYNTIQNVRSNVSIKSISIQNFETQIPQQIVKISYSTISKMH